MIVTVTYQNQYGPKYNVAEVNAPFTDLNESLNYAYRWTQNITGSWSNKIGEDANDNVAILHYHNDGSGLRSSMVGDEFTVQLSDREFKKFKCARIGFEEVA